MNNVKRFNTRRKFDKYIETKITDICLGKGNEGIVYLGCDGLAYKIFYKDVCKYNKSCSYDADDFVTVRDINLDSFALPIKLFCIKNKVIGYTSKCVEKDLLLNNYINNRFLYNIGVHSISFSKEAIYDFLLDSLREIDYSKMKLAYQKLYNDTLLLSNVGIKMSTLCGNILFDGNSFVVVDTSNFIRTDENVNLYNNKLLEMDLKEELEYINNIISSSYISKDNKMYGYIKFFCENINEELLYNPIISKKDDVKKLSLKK